MTVFSSHLYVVVLAALMPVKAVLIAAVWTCLPGCLQAILLVNWLKLTMVLYYTVCGLHTVLFTALSTYIELSLHCT
jgi:hypothetical protein